MRENIFHILHSVFDFIETIKKTDISVETAMLNVEEKVIEPLPEKKYYIIGGSFLIQKNADILKNEFIATGYPAEVIQADNSPRFRVSYASHPDRSVALTELKKIRESENSSAWLLKK